MQINDLKLTAIETALEHHIRFATLNDEDTSLATAALKAVEETRNSTATDLQLDQARLLHATDELEIDDDATVSEADDGYWVQAWVWVPRSEDDDADPD